MRLYTSRDDERRDVFDLNQGRVERRVERDRPEWIRWALRNSSTAVRYLRVRSVEF